MWICQCFNRDSCQNIHWLIFISFKYFLFILCLCNTKLCWGKGIFVSHFYCPNQILEFILYGPNKVLLVLCQWTGAILFYYFHLFILASVHVFPYRIMKRKYKQWWSTIPSISTKRTITSHLNSLNTYDVGNPDPGLGQT
jgi:hypothetical protein